MPGTGTIRSASMMAEDQESSSVAELLAEALHNKEHQKLYLNYKGLVQLPSQLLDSDDYQHIQNIYAKRNLLTTLPSEISRLCGLRILYLHSNKLSSLPSELQELKHLESLDISDNAFTHFPEVICRISSLQKLFLSSNQITSIPPEIGQLQELTVLNLMNNLLVTLPSEIGQCSCLETLQLDRNKLRLLPRHLIYLHGLKELSAAGNNLTFLPMGLGWLPNLNNVYVDSNPSLFSVPFTLWTKQVGVSRCGTSPPPDELCLKVGPLRGVLPPEIRVCYDESAPTEQPRTLLELAFLMVHRCRDSLAVSSLPKSLSDLVETPTAHCMGHGCDTPIFTWAHAHLLQIPWIQERMLGGNDRVSLIGLCCSRRCHQIFQRHPIPT